MNKKTKIITHSGSFHPDDCFAVAVLFLHLENKHVEPVVLRTRDQSEIVKGDFVVDVGGEYDPEKMRFDHHQVGGAGKRENGVPYASFGLVWKKFGVEISGSESVAGIVDKKLVQPIDFGDNLGLSLKELADGVYPYTLDHLIASFNQTGEESLDVDKIFFRMVDLAKDVIRRELMQAKSVELGKPPVELAYKKTDDKRIIVFDAEYSWYDILSKYPEPLFVVSPDEKTGNWSVTAVRKGEYLFENRLDLPKAWAGKRNSELGNLSGVEDAIFCHNQLFFAVAKSKEGAIALARKALI